VIVINGGSYDIGSKRNQTNKVSVKMAQFMQKHNNSIIIIIIIIIMIKKGGSLILKVNLVSPSLPRSS